MKATDIQIGDYLYSIIDRYDYIEKKIVKVTGIRTDSNTPLILCDDTDVWYHIGSYEPISLTKEILEKNGFINKKDRFMQSGNFDNPPLILWHLNNDKILGYPAMQLEIHNGSKSCHVRFICQYAHQLQHALRLCGIDKEITL